MVLPSETGDLHVTSLTKKEAEAMSMDFVHAYEDILDVELECLMKYSLSHNELVRCSDGTVENVTIVAYHAVYISLLDDAPPSVTCRRPFDHIGHLGGFMSLVNASGITNGRWMLIERLRAIYERAFSKLDKPSPHLFGGVAIGINQTVRVDPNATPSIDIGHTVIGQLTAIWHTPPSNTADTMTEHFSLADILGLDSPIENKMQQDPYAKSVSSISCSAPSIEAISGIPEDWASFNSDDAPFDVFRPPCGYGGSSITIPAGTLLNNTLLGLARQLPIITAREARPIGFAVDSSLIHPYHDDFWRMPDDISHWTEWEEVQYSHLEEVSLYTVRWGAALFSWIRSPVEDLAVSTDVLSKCLDEAGMTPSMMTSMLNLSATGVSVIPLLIDSLFDAYTSFQSSSLGKSISDMVEKTEIICDLSDQFNLFMSNTAGITIPTAFATREDAEDFFNRHRESLILGWCAFLNEKICNAENMTLQYKINFLCTTLSWQDIVRYMYPAVLSTVRPMNGAPALDRVIAINFARSDMDSGKEFNKSSPKLYLYSDISINGSFTYTDRVSEGPRIVVERREMCISTWHDRSLSRSMEVTSPISGSCIIKNVGTTTAYNLSIYNTRPGCKKIYEECSSSLDSLAPGENITITYELMPLQTGLYRDLPVICVYYSRPLNTLNTSAPSNWDGLHYYVTTPIEHLFYITRTPNILDWFTDTTAGIPNYLIVGMASALGIAVVVLLVRRRK